MSTCYKRAPSFSLLVPFLLFCASSTQGQIGQGQTYDLDFTKPASVKGKVELSPEDKLGLTEQGLGNDTGAFALLRNAWLQTTEPIALGLSWRPTSGVTIRARLDVDFDHEGVYSVGALYVRYSPDALHWSQWQEVEGGTRSDKSVRTHTYGGHISIPNREREGYLALQQKFWNTKPEWPSDEEAGVRWIIKSDPHFFEKYLPFMGYIQFLFESPLMGGQHLRLLHIDLFWSVGGLAVMPKKFPQERMGPWRYRVETLHPPAKGNKEEKSEGKRGETKGR